MSVVCNVSATFMPIANRNLHPTLLQQQAICTSKDPELNYAFKLNLHSKSKTTSRLWQKRLQISPQEQLLR